MSVMDIITLTLQLSCNIFIVVFALLSYFTGLFSVSGTENLQPYSETFDGKLLLTSRCCGTWTY